MPDVPAGTARIDLKDRIRAAWGALNGRAFGPGMPSEAALPLNSAPRQFQYPPSSNMTFAPRQEQPNLTPFEQLRNLAAMYDVAAMCIAARIEEMQGLGWSIVAKDKRLQPQLQDECDAVAQWFGSPDQRNDFLGWLSMLLYELFTTDAMSLYLRPDQNGDLYGLEPVDGATMKPVLNDLGHTVEYQQVMYGRPETSYSPQQLWYRPRWRRTFTPYGFPPSEWIVMRVNTALRKQAFDLTYFTDGNIPDMIATPPPGLALSPDQVAEFETWFNAVLSGNDAARRKVRFLAWEAQLRELRPFNYETTLDEWMLRVTCAAYSVPPQELGFTTDVNKATGDMQEAINERRGLKPLSAWLKQVIFDPVIQKRLAGTLGMAERVISLPGAPTRMFNPLERMEWQWHFGSKDDALLTAQVDQIYYSIGVVSPDEIRAVRYGDVLDGKAPGAPIPVDLMGGPNPDPYLPTMSPAQGTVLPEGRGRTPPSPLPLQVGKGVEHRQMDAVDPDEGTALRMWEKKAVKAVRAGKGAGVGFESEQIRVDVRGFVERGLAKAQGEADVAAVFDAALALSRGDREKPALPSTGAAQGDALDGMDDRLRAALDDYVAGLQQRVLEAADDRG